MVKRTMVKLLLTDNAFPTDKQLKRDIFLSCCGSTDNALEEKSPRAEAILPKSKLNRNLTLIQSLINSVGRPTLILSTVKEIALGV